jgi:hypothetical protein
MKSTLFHVNLKCLFFNLDSFFKIQGISHATNISFHVHQQSGPHDSDP